MTDKERGFVGSLLWLVNGDNPEAPDLGALAALRMGLGKRPGESLPILRYIAPHLDHTEGPTADAMFLVAPLFGRYPKHDKTFRDLPLRDFGDSLWWATQRRANPEGKHQEAGVELRFSAGLDSDPEDLPRHLSSLVSLCESAGVPINWFRFFDDVRLLLSPWPDHHDPSRTARDAVRVRWARHFWQGPTPAPTIQEIPE